jgi:ATP-dependent DNA helicase RecG
MIRNEFDMAEASPATGKELRYTINRKNLEAPVRSLKGVGPKTAELLGRKGIATIEDLLYLVPLRYEDRRRLLKVSELTPGRSEVFHAVVLGSASVPGKGGRRFFEVVVGDESGTVTLKWFHFNPRYMKEIWQPGKRGIFTGELVLFGNRREIHHPDADWLADGTEPGVALRDDPIHYGRIVPVYPLTEGLQQKSLRKLLKVALDTCIQSVETWIPPCIIRRCSLLPAEVALREVHFPGEDADIDALNTHSTKAHRTLVFEEFFFLQLGLALRKHGTSRETGIPFLISHKYTRPLLKSLPFSLTAAQKRVLTEIKEDLVSSHPMYRLVQGDVGSGKTIVALMAALLAVENGYQTAIMAPTELLAEQHYLNIHRLCEQLGIAVRLLTARVKGKERSLLLDAVASGEVQIVIGTHAVIQEKVSFCRLGLGVIDEQHRFGVLQRRRMKSKGQNPHVLVMTATPIPRTLAMTVYGDLSVSVIDELPPGRSPISTRVCRESQRDHVCRLVRDEVRTGRQAYIIYPLVEESESSELKAASHMSEHLATDIFPDLRIGLLHGRMKPAEKETVMRAFSARDIDVLVATTVIEVGIDVPNATIMVIEHAERFGLSQLHQLRGRVGRGVHASKCILMAGKRLSEEAERRLRVLEQTCDGFRIAEADLELRGPGDFLGTRQSGIPDVSLGDIIRDRALLEEARREAFSLVEHDPHLTSGDSVLLRRELVRRWGGRLELAGVA